MYESRRSHQATEIIRTFFLYQQTDSQSFSRIVGGLSGYEQRVQSVLVDTWWCCIAKFILAVAVVAVVILDVLCILLSPIVLWKRPPGVVDYFLAGYDCWIFVQLFVCLMLVKTLTLVSVPQLWRWDGFGFPEVSQDCWLNWLFFIVLALFLSQLVVKIRKTYRAKKYNERSISSPPPPPTLLAQGRVELTSDLTHESTILKTKRDLIGRCSG